MGNINSVVTLQNAIQLLEVEQADKRQLLKEQFYLTYESLKPVNLLKRTLNDIATSPFLIDNILNTGMGLVSGWLSKKVFIGTSGNLFRKLMGSVLQFGITKIIAQHPDTTKSLGQFIFRHILRKKELNSREE
jgi:hypothetical protein